MKRKNWCELVDISSMFPGLLYSDEMESKGMMVPRFVQDELRKPKTNMKEEGSLTFEILEERVKSCDFVLESSSFVLKSSSWLFLKSFSNIQSLVSKSFFISVTVCWSCSNCPLGVPGSTWKKKKDSHLRKIGWQGKPCTEKTWLANAWQMEEMRTVMNINGNMLPSPCSTDW